MSSIFQRVSLGSACIAATTGTSANIQPEMDGWPEKSSGSTARASSDENHSSFVEQKWRKETGLNSPEEFRPVAIPANRGWLFKALNERKPVGHAKPGHVVPSLRD